MLKKLDLAIFYTFSTIQDQRCPRNGGHTVVYYLLVKTKYSGLILFMSIS